MIQSRNANATVRENLRASQILCAALMIGIVIFTIAVAILNLVREPFLKAESWPVKNIFLYAAFCIAFACFFVANALYKKKIAIIKNAMIPLGDKLNQYRVALIIFMALCEGAALFSIIVFFLIGNFVLLVITAAMLAAMFSKMPFQKKVVAELDLDWKDQQEFL